MDKRIIFLFAVIFIIGSVSAFSWPICIDTQAPEAPAGLIVSGNVQLTWNEAVDKPDCSEIEHYNIYLDGSSGKVGCQFGREQAGVGTGNVNVSIKIYLQCIYGFFPFGYLLYFVEEDIIFFVVGDFGFYKII